MAQIIGISLGAIAADGSVSSNSFSERVEVTYIVQTDKTGVEGAIEAYNATPSFGSSLAEANSLSLRSKSVRQSSKSKIIFEVSCTYSREIKLEAPPGQQPPQEIPPLHRPPEIAFSSELVEEEITKTADGKEITNAVGQPFDPPLTRPKCRINLNVRLNKAPNKVKAKDWMKIAGSINSKEFLGFPRGTVMFMDFSAESLRFELGQYYVPVSFGFKVKMEGWNPVQVLNIGTRYWTNACKCDANNKITNKNQGDCRLVPTTQEGFVTAERVFLDLCGKKSEKPYYKSFDIYVEYDLNKLFD